MKLNLGCGSRKLAGFVNVDSAPHCEPDRLVDLETLPWPFETSCAEEIVLSHVLEHLGQTPKLYLAIIQELYRVCAPGALVRITVPHPRHDDYLSDPTHVRPITLQGLELFSRRKNLDWQAKGQSATPLALVLGVDFEVVSADAQPEEPWLGRLRRREITGQELAFAARSYWNVIRATDIVLRAVKSAP
ncbi:hypothetical protein EDC65_2797 [Stella humosa]|uniref:Methyltransferase family protein n=1 Tax=Stella humosa TaxID=94 RepID=A0A3N1LHE3_9PROT|nr:hypothetical protein [Stella humosa]ROP90937.1 hypothetical protein EDC65_2797 [Stella humosa]BBK34713.1 hypothetical protein STHU_53470 [Stella humosa]